MRLSEQEDKVLVKLFVEGNQRAFEMLVQRHQERVFGYIQSMTKDEALTADVFQDCFIKVIKTVKAGRYNDSGKFLPWILRIAHNLVIDHYRRTSKMPLVARGKSGEDFDIFDLISDGSLNKEEKMAKGQIKSDVRQLINALPSDQKEVVIMRHFFDMSFKEISEQTDVSINTALGRMRYALINMRKMADEKNKVLSSF